jgi:hypothetical protein
MYVQHVEDMDPREPDLEGRTLKHPLMQAELRRQREDLELLEGMSDDPKVEIPRLKRKWRKPKKGSLGLDAPV